MKCDMHIAVCDDNIADRKQTERLLGRQSDRFFKENGGRLYLDSYGNVEALMRYPQMYDALFIDMTSAEPTGFEVARLLLNVGVVRPIILVVSSIDYRKQYAESGINVPNILFLDKPIKVAELTAIMDEIRKIKGAPTPTMEIRSKNGTVYAKNDEIVCVKKKGAELFIYMEDGNILSIIDDIYNFYDQCAVFPQICPVNDNALINVNHIQKTSFGKVTMDNGEVIGVSFIYRNSISQAKELINNESN
ncbi:LytR/AlgR family response regulator transcription factor [Butyrivibrio sp. YAB3001]|uniref:LytR/AlgR family response regulator transcription factor n=1 Tax=Butyrivibrio sp. YAB3001 TaxID=1520812 RepID=UPI0008F679CF|nr:response regulator [Butyrivibrio sp. YAB3001]SFB72308.1 DNA-binding response regulator, LytR/AlgR family [Butyrivibrio sp. YAB3001]